ncbi:MAG: YggS family pyridoxal phosphate-dependent enzyme [Bacilli bacterium]|nr:YggS family pyridoxal phosphate-dependent enzyme [Bacilli bacterium]
MDIKGQLNKVKETIKDYPDVRIVAATKYITVEQTKELLDAGIRDLGENRTDSFLEKYEAYKDHDDITWHFFGVLQTRKVRSVIDKIDYLHSLDNLSLANEINKRRTTPLKCFVQVNVSSDPNKSGIDETKVIPFIKSLSKYENIEIVGLMTIARFTFDQDLLEGYFETMQALKEEVQALNLPYAPCTELSMGMSNDYKYAVKYGATMIRLGRVLLS